MKKLHVGDSINFKDGRVGIVEDYDDKYFYVRDNNTNVVKIKKIKDDDVPELEYKFSYCKQDIENHLEAKGLKLHTAYNGPDTTFYLRMITENTNFNSDNYDSWTEENITKPIESLMERKYPKFYYDLEPILLNSGQIGVTIHIQAKDSSNITDLSKSVESNEVKQLLETTSPQNVNKALNAVLTEHEKKIIELRFGLNGENQSTYEEIGKIFNVTKERIRQIEAKALRKLKHPKSSKYLKKDITKD